MVQRLPNLTQFKKSGERLIQNLQPESKGAEQVKKEVEDFETCWKKLEQDAKESVEKVRRCLMVIWLLQPGC